MDNNKKTKAVDHLSYAGNNPELQETYRNACHIGFLQKLVKSWRGLVWEENFFLLTNVGLLVFEKPGENKLKNFIPTLGAHIIKDPKHPYEKKHVLKIMFSNSETEILLATRSDSDTVTWVKALEKIQNKAIIEPLKKEDLIVK